MTARFRFLDFRAPHSTEEERAIRTRARRTHYS
jgi:hypothetical protein